MCEIFNLDHIADLKELECYCSEFYPKLGLSHSLSAVVTDSNYRIFQCAEKIFTNIKIDNSYFHIAQDYVTIQHERYGCNVKSFIVMLGCLLHHTIELMEENLSNRYIIQGIQEGLEILIHLYRKSSKKIEEYQINKTEKTFGRETTEYLKNQITKYIIKAKTSADEDPSQYSYQKIMELNIHRLCHYDCSDMINILWDIVKGILFENEENNKMLSIANDTNTIKSIGALLTHTFSSSGFIELSAILSKIKDGIQNVMTITSTQFFPNEITNFVLYSGIVLPIKLDTARILNKFAGLKNCLLFLCDLNSNMMDKQCDSWISSYVNEFDKEVLENNWIKELIRKIKTVQVNCVLVSGTCDSKLRNEFLINMDISVIENVSPRKLETISSIMDVNTIHDLNSMFTPCQLLINVIKETKHDKNILCSIQIPQWMKIFGVTNDNLKTVVVHHRSREIAETLRESFIHNLRRIENAISIGYFVDGGGSLELEFAAELRARANDKIIHNKGDESIEIKSKVLLAITNALELFHFHLKSNLSNSSMEPNNQMKIDDLESKIGSLQLLSECLTNLFATNLIVWKSIPETSVPNYDLENLKEKNNKFSNIS